jgi:hypothetical protein
MNEAIEDQLFIASITFDDWHDNLFFCGPAAEIAERQFAECLSAADPTLCDCVDFTSYRSWVVSLFNGHGFRLIKK